MRTRVASFFAYEGVGRNIGQEGDGYFGDCFRLFVLLEKNWISLTLGGHESHIFGLSDDV